FQWFQFKPTATSGTYTLSLHDALPIWLPLPRSVPYPGDPRGILRLAPPPQRRRAPHPPPRPRRSLSRPRLAQARPLERERLRRGDRKSTRLNSSHVAISYAVFCLKERR